MFLGQSEIEESISHVGQCARHQDRSGRLHGRPSNSEEQKQMENLLCQTEKGFGSLDIKKIITDPSHSEREGISEGLKWKRS